jgi:hypothetical protein
MDMEHIKALFFQPFPPRNRVCKGPSSQKYFAHDYLYVCFVTQATMSVDTTETIHVYQRLAMWFTSVRLTPRGGTSRFTPVLKTKRRATSTWQSTCVIPSFCHEADEKYALLGYDMASSGNFLPTFRDNLSVHLQRSKIQNSWPQSTVFLAEYVFVTMCCSHQVHPLTIFISTERCIQWSEHPVHRH